MDKFLNLAFKKIYNSAPAVLSFAPGRVNIIGEHTDYNQGYVLPAALNLRNYFLASRRQDDEIFIWAENFEKKDTFSLKNISFSERNKWVNYIKGIYWTLLEEGLMPGGMNGLIWGNIPLEAGLSSSAALEVSVIQGLNTLFRLGLAPKKMAELAQKAENDFVGVKCGLMDQFISVFGQKNKAMFLDCESLEYELIPLQLEKAKLRIVVFESGVRRKLDSSEYNKRRIESARALEFLKRIGAKSYKQATLNILKDRKKKMGEVFFKRARHVISENGRVKEAVEALKENDFRFLGELLFRSHESLRDDYEVSCPELDLFYDMARKFSGCLGARLTGAGFGGSGIALVEKKRVDVFRKKLLEEASEKGFVCPKVYEVEVGEGAKSCYLNREEKG